MLEITETHFEYTIKCFKKYSRRTTKKSLLLYPCPQESLFSEAKNEENVERLDTKEEVALLNNCWFLFKKDFEAFIPQIKSEMKKYTLKNNFAEIKKESYIRMFLMIYLGGVKIQYRQHIRKQQHQENK
jgi:hypothetical protein